MGPFALEGTVQLVVLALEVVLHAVEFFTEFLHLHLVVLHEPLIRLFHAAVSQTSILGKCRGRIRFGTGIIPLTAQDSPGYPDS